MSAGNFYPSSLGVIWWLLVSIVLNVTAIQAALHSSNLQQNLTAMFCHNLHHPIAIFIFHFYYLTNLHNCGNKQNYKFKKIKS